MIVALSSFIKKNKSLPYEFDASEFISIDGFTIENLLPIEKLITTEYSIVELEMFFGKFSSMGPGFIEELGEPKNLSWNDVNSTFPVQCLRYHKNAHYSVYRVSEGGLFYVFWMVPLATTPNELIDEACPIRVRFSIYLNGLASLKDFQPMKKMSTAQDVMQRDPQMQIDFFASSGLYSYNLLDNGKVLEIRYTYEKLEELSDLIIEDYKVLAKSDCTAAISCIDEFDLP